MSSLSLHSDSAFPIVYLFIFACCTSIVFCSDVSVLILIVLILSPRFDEKRVSITC